MHFDDDSVSAVVFQTHYRRIESDDHFGGGSGCRTRQPGKAGPVKSARTQATDCGMFWRFVFGCIALLNGIENERQRSGHGNLDRFFERIRVGICTRYPDGVIFGLE
jgi:hypothetical protein